MKCKICGEEINLHIFGCPEDVCYGCLSQQAKEQVAEINVNTLK